MMRTVVRAAIHYFGFCFNARASAHRRLIIRTARQQRTLSASTLRLPERRQPKNARGCISALIFVTGCLASSGQPRHFSAVISAGAGNASPCHMLLLVSPLLTSVHAFTASGRSPAQGSCATSLRGRSQTPHTRSAHRLYVIMVMLHFSLGAHCSSIVAVGCACLKAIATFSSILNCSPFSTFWQARFLGNRR